ncbi:hypothetical protein QL919_13640 [Psychrobacter sp. APC 3426]|uniref:hypothetical protein n=1 Tax=Psychrobacter sp. APC 3426 TaxID=3035177 RepID=UPI0025B2D469|nr:hypothetical protein [Psychrobacter sp. APC 3426]MDN3399769.1 hypothetical protein [Psychrobacter sp. APC 3426]
MSHSSSQSKYTRRYHPRHPLAQYLISQIETMQLRAPDIIKAMGYPLGHTIPACERLRHVLCNRYLGLDSSYMDKYFTADAFLAKLFVVLELPYEPFVEDIAQIKYQLAHLPNDSPKYSLRAGVDFEFDSAQWMSCDATKNHQLIVEQDRVKVDKVERKLAKASGA